MALYLYCYRTIVFALTIVQRSRYHVTPCGTNPRIRCHYHWSFWDTLAPPRHYNCTSRITTLRQLCRCNGIAHVFHCWFTNRFAHHVRFNDSVLVGEQYQLNLRYERLPFANGNASCWHRTEGDHTYELPRICDNLLCDNLSCMLR